MLTFSLLVQGNCPPSGFQLGLFFLVLFAFQMPIEHCLLGVLLVAGFAMQRVVSAVDDILVGVFGPPEDGTLLPTHVEIVRDELQHLVQVDERVGSSVKALQVIEQVGDETQVLRTVTVRDVKLFGLGDVAKIVKAAQKMEVVCALEHGQIQVSLEQPMEIQVLAEHLLSRKLSFHFGVPCLPELHPSIWVLAVVVTNRLEAIVELTEHVLAGDFLQFLFS
mmetsp:Transcript_25083/g.27828  ORF Transcript_25083/g.27828 Transcript_25083/m.27828 type:complete len:221 (+) Transcript_25083:649-1311(+)